MNALLDKINTSTVITAKTAGNGKTSGRVVSAAIPEDFVNVERYQA